MADQDRMAQTMRIEIPIDQLEHPEPVQRAAPKPAGDRPPGVRPKMGEPEYALYHEFMQSIYDAVVIADAQGNIVDGNSRAVEFFRYAAADLCGASVFEIVAGFDPSVLETIISRLANGQFTLIDAYCYRRDGSYFPSEIATSILHLGGEAHLCFFVRDITKRKEDEDKLRRTQEQLARAERLEMAGSIAGHIAHDFNNLLTPLLAYPEFIREELPENSQSRQDLTIIEKTAQQIAEINQQLLALSRRGHHEQRVLSVNGIVEDVVMLLRRGGQFAGIEIELCLAEDLLNIKGAPEQLLRVVQNLCQNAFDAMGEKGILTIVTENVYLDMPLKRYESVTPGEYVKLSVSDTGHGVPPEIIDKIFDPFFTTKRATRQRGSGLGLSVVHGIVKDHNGYIDIVSQIGEGTTFVLYFPTCREGIADRSEEKHANGGTETILIVDDDPLQIEVTSRIVAKQGYSVLSAQSGESALGLMEMARQQSKFPALAILDMIMGSGMDGAQTFQRMKEINPKQKAIILSGYAESAKVAMAQAQGAGAYLRKPVAMEKLCRAIREELDRPSNGDRPGGQPH